MVARTTLAGSPNIGSPPVGNFTLSRSGCRYYIKFLLRQSTEKLGY